MKAVFRIHVPSACRVTTVRDIVFAEDWRVAGSVGEGVGSRKSERNRSGKSEHSPVRSDDD